MYCPLVVRHRRCNALGHFRHKGRKEMLTCEAIRNHTVELGFVPPSQRPTGAAFQHVQFILETTLLCGFLLVFLYFKYAHPRRRLLHHIRVRQTRWVVTTCLGAMCGVITGSYFMSTPLESGLPCYFQIFAETNTVPLIVAPVLIRLYYFNRTDELTHTLAVAPCSAAGTGKMATVAEEVTATATSESPTNNKDEEEVAGKEEEEADSSNGRARVVWNCFARRGERIEDKLLRLQLESSKSAMLVLQFVCLAPILASAVVFVALQENVTCRGCKLSEAGLFTIVVQGVLSVGIIAAFLVSVRGKHDSFGVLREIRLGVCFGGIPTLFCFILSFAVGPVGEFHFIILVEIFFVVIVYFQTVHPCLLAQREYASMLVALESYHLSIQEFEFLVMREDGPYHSAFCTHLAAEHSLESTAFLSAITLFEQHYYDAGPKTNQSRMRRILAMYVGDNAVLPCNLSAKVVEPLLVPGLPPSFTMFAPAREELYAMLYRDAFTRFLATKEFQAIHQREQLASAAPPDAELLAHRSRRQSHV